VNRLEPDAVLRDFLFDKNLAHEGDAVTWTPLAGGVSSDIWRVDTGARTLCIKRALPRLKVAQEWNAPVERNAYEWAWLRFAFERFPDNVPEPIASDASRGILAMAYLDPGRHPVWKRRLLDGDVAPDKAASVARVVVALHAASAGSQELAARFATDAIFHAIRLEPYLLATAARHPDLASSLFALAERTAATRRALVHGDMSPKNVLLGPRGPVLLDAECAWYGDPAFDAAFCLNHFLLKCVARRQWAPGYLACYQAFAEAYLTGVTWEPRDAIEARIASLLPALFLARIDGKSPVEYITDERERQRVRNAARPLVAHATARLEEIAARWSAALESQRPVG
jgi:aminoglycoside phosphotransferase (APT) family kinase protein